MANKQIEALEKLIALKDETIKELERQVQLLKNQPPVVVPQFPEIPQVPINPWSQPINPWSQPINPQWPWSQPSYGPYIVTSGTTVTITNDPTATYTLTNSDSSTNVIDFKTCSRA
jgi:hypothetical protein